MSINFTKNTRALMVNIKLNLSYLTFEYQEDSCYAAIMILYVSSALN